MVLFRQNTRAAAPRRSRSKFRAEGDKAREQRAWAKAAEHYRSHLLLAPDDTAIWVQLGHMLKETGSHSDALQAYRVAWQQAPEDVDILLHFGHALASSGDLNNGLARLREAASLGCSQAAQDLTIYGEQIISSPSPAREAVLPGTLAALATETGDLVPVNYSSIILRGNNFHATGNDPWIELDWKPTARPQDAIVLLTIEMTVSGTADKAPIGQVYADMGEGFSERNSARFSLSSGKAQVLLLMPQHITRLRLDPDQQQSTFSPPKLSITQFASAEDLAATVKQHAHPDADCSALLRLLGEVSRNGQATKLLPPVIALDHEIDNHANFSHDYNYWLYFNANPDTGDYQKIREIDRQLAIKPKFSFVMPTYNTPIDLLCECLDSLLVQSYPDFEICIADDNSPNRDVVATLERYAARDSRVKYVARKTNGHISAASNSALELASGDFVVLVDHDDLIPNYTLSVIAHYINKHPDADIFFSDEDKVNLHGDRLHPYFKGCFNKFLMYGQNMVSHIGVYRRTLVTKVGGFRMGLEGSQDYDLLLRCFEKCGDGGIVHIPHVLYNWRILPGSTAMSADQKSYAITAAQSAINGHFERTGMPFRSTDGFAPGCTAIKPTRIFDTSVSIIIPTRNGLHLLKPCIDSIFQHDHANVEIVIVDNGSDEAETLAYLADIARSDNVTVVRDPGAFNFSRINNLAARAAKGDILCFLNNDTEVVSADWINRARAFLSLNEVGIVGARLLFPDGTLQHFGIALGMGAHRIAGHPHLSFEGTSPGYFGKARLLQEFSAVTAACMFIRKADFTSVGGFDEELSVAYNDIDLCLKIRESGLKVLADPDITLIHKESRSRGSDKEGSRAARLAIEAKWMRDRWGETLDNDPYYSPNIDLDRVDFAYATKPRCPWPWEIDLPGA